MSAQPAGSTPSSVLYDAFREVASRRPHSAAVRTTSSAWQSYGDLLALVDRLAGGLSQNGVRAGDTLALALGNSEQYVALLLAMCRVGACYAPIMENFSPEQSLDAYRRLSVRALVVDGSRPAPEGGLPRLELGALATAAPLGPPEAAAPYAGQFRCLWTSGSTGMSKIVVWRQDKLLAERRRWVAAVGVRDTDVFFCRHTLDVAHATDLHVFPALLTGGRLIIATPATSAEQLLSQLDASRATIMSALPVHYDQLAEAAERQRSVDLSLLRLPLCGGAYLGPSTVSGAWERLRIRIRQIYGATEFGLALGDDMKRPSAPAGMVPVPGVEASISSLSSESPQIGELVLRSDCTSEGYLDDAAANARTFRGDAYWSGDVVRRWPDGAYEILGRTTEALAAATGPLLAPVLDDEITKRCPVEECVSFPGTPGRYDRDVVVVACRRPGISDAAVTESVRRVVDEHALVGVVHVVDEIPHTPVGKADKPALIRKFAERNRAA